MRSWRVSKSRLVKERPQWQVYGFSFVSTQDLGSAGRDAAGGWETNGFGGDAGDVHFVRRRGRRRCRSAPDDFLSQIRAVRSAWP